MADQEQGAHEAGRRAQEASRRAQQRQREATDETRRTAEQFMSIGAETITVWADIQQRVIRDAMQLTSDSLQETTRLTTALQQTTLDGVQEMQAMAWRWQALWPEAFRDPLRWYERAVGEMVENTRRSLCLSRTGLETMGQSFDRIHDSTGQLASTVQETFREAVGRMQEVSQRAERLRAA